MGNFQLRVNKLHKNIFGFRNIFNNSTQLNLVRGKYYKCPTELPKHTLIMSTTGTITVCVEKQIVHQHSLIATHYTSIHTSNDNKDTN